MNVDNGFKIWRYNGQLLHHSEREKLYEAKWQPMAAGTHEDRPISPGSVRKESERQVNGGAPSGVASNKPAPYRPPHATTGSGNFSLAKAAPEDSGPGKYRAPGTLSTSATSKVSGPPGSTFVDSQVSKSAAKNAKKRAAAKAKKAAAEA